jgi:hypothetical protein
MGKPKAPEPPDPQETAAAQTGTNIGTAVANSYLGNVNQQTPYGSLTYQQTGSNKWTDPNSGDVYDLPTWTAVQTLSPQQQAIQTQNDKANLNLATLAATQSGKLNNLLGTPFNLNGAPAAGDPSKLTLPQYQQFGSGPQLQTSVGNTGTIQNSIAPAGSITNSIANAGNIQTQVGDAGDITKSYGTDYASNVQEVQDALMARQQPYLDQDRSALETRLANQGIQIGSAAYNSAMDDFNRQVNDARYGAILNAGQEQSRLAGLAQQQAQFQNSAQAQAYQQALASGQFTNSAQAQQYQQNASNAAFANQAQQQQFGQNQAQAEFGNDAQAQQYQQALADAQLANTSNQQMYQNQNTAAAANNALKDQTFNSQQAQINAQNQARANWLNEQYAQRSQPLNEIIGLLGGAQVQNPNFVPTQGQSIPTVDYAGLVQQNYANQMGAYNSQMAQQQSLLGGLFGLGAAGIMASDERVKEDIEKVGEVEGHNVYRFRYKAGGPMQLGVMAQEVEEDRPDVVEEIGGVKHVNYGKLFHLGEAA